MSNFKCVVAPHILLPNKKVDMNAFAVIACDQFTSQVDYWDSLKKEIGNKPSTFNRKEHPDWPVIYATNFALDTWFEYEGNTNYRADITWTFTRPELIVYRLPTSDVISRATMTFKDSAFPETVGEEVKCALVGTVTFEGAVATTSYEIIFKTLPEGEGI